MNKYKIRITCLEDIMPGSGESVPGIIDNDILLDEDGLPYMHAKAFKGHLREQMELLKFNDAPTAENGECCYPGVKVDVLLGGRNIDAAESGKLKLSDIHLSEEVRSCVAEQLRLRQLTKEELLDSLTVVRRFTRINEDGVADDGSLRTARLVIGGLVFETYLYAEELTEAEKRFVRDAVKAIQHIGTYKSKGKGTVRCEIDMNEAVSDGKSADMAGNAAEAVFSSMDDLDGGNTVANGAVGTSENTAKYATDTAVANGAGIASEHVGEYVTEAAIGDACKDSAANVVTNINEGSARNYVKYSIFLEEPVKMGSEGNQSNTDALTYLAGSSLRGTLIAEYIKRYHPEKSSFGTARENGLDQDPELAGILFRDTYFYDAYPVIGDQTFIPMPEIFYADKHELRAVEREGGENYPVHCCVDENPGPGEIRVGSGQYCLLEGSRLKMLRVKKTANLHIAVGKTDDKGEHREEGKMFRYEAIAAGQTFAGLIRCKDEDTARAYAQALRGGEGEEKVVYLGGSRGSGYGRCVIKDVSCVSEEEQYGAKWRQANVDGHVSEEQAARGERHGIEGQPVREAQHSVKERPDSEEGYSMEGQPVGEFTIYALSNLLLLDQYGSETGSFDEAALAEKLGVSKVRLKKANVSVIRATGFNNVWRAGQVQRAAVKAGSFYVYSCDGTPNPEKIKELERDGIGLRRQEGFGRILFNLDVKKNELTRVRPEREDGKAIPSMQAAGGTKFTGVQSVFESGTVNAMTDKEGGVSETVISKESRENLGLIEKKINENRLEKQLRAAAYICAAETCPDNSDRFVRYFSLTQIARLYNLLSELDEMKDEEKAKESLERFRGELKNKTRKAYAVSKLMVRCGENVNKMSMFGVLNNICDDSVPYTVFGLEFEASQDDGCKHSEFHFDRLGKAQTMDGGFAGKSTFRLKCEFMLQTLRYIMRRKGGSR
jgi:CRISPR-associated protein Csx10